MADSSLPRSGIYCIRNMVSGRVYVGSAVYIKARWSNHRAMLRKGSHHSRALQRSWCKHGDAAFSFEVLEAVAELARLIAREQYWIDRLRAASPTGGFNMYPYANSPLGTKRSMESRAKQSASAKGKKRAPFSAEHRAAISAASKGRRASMTARAKMSAAHKGRALPPNQAAQRKAMLEIRNRSPEHRKKVSAAATGRKASPETLEKMRIASTGKKLSIEARQKISAVHKGRKKSAAHHKKLAAILAKRNRRRSVGDLTDQLKLL